MIKKICFYIFLFFCFVLNIILDANIKNYIIVLEKCFERNIVLNDKMYVAICTIIALNSILIVIDILLVVCKKKNKNNGIKIKSEDGTHGTADWMQEKEIQKVLGVGNVPGIILGKSYRNRTVKLPFDSFFNKNICVFGSSRQYENDSIFNDKFIRIINVQKIHYCNRP